MSEHLRRHAGISGAKAALVYEVLDKSQLEDAKLLARAIHRLPLTLKRPRPLAETISSAGGVRLDHVAELQPLTNRDAVLRLHDGTPVRVSRTYIDALLVALHAHA